MKNANQKSEMKSAFSALHPPLPHNSPLLGYFIFAVLPQNDDTEINENITCNCRVYLRPRWKVNLLKEKVGIPVFSWHISFVCFNFL